MATQFMPISEVEESFGDPIADSTGSEDSGLEFGGDGIRRFLGREFASFWENGAVRALPDQGSRRRFRSKCAGTALKNDYRRGVIRVIMKNRVYLIVLAPLLLASCETEPVVTTTTTEVRQEVVRTQGDRVVGREVIVSRTPPAVQVETQPASPGTEYVWTRGYWRWTGTDYVWVPGSYVARPRPAAVWVQGQWVSRPGGWVWVPGRWQ
jgi:hypothetical protein